MLRFCCIKPRVLLLNSDYGSWPALSLWSASSLINVKIVPWVLTFLHAWFCRIVGVTPLTIQMFLGNNKSAGGTLSFCSCLLLYCGRTHRHKDFIRHGSHTVCSQLSVNVDIIQLIFTSWIPMSPIFHFAFLPFGLSSSTASWNGHCNNNISNDNDNRVEENACIATNTIPLWQRRPSS